MIKYLYYIDIGNNCVICLKKFFRKYKAIIIEIVGKELKNMDTEFCYNIKRSLESDIQNDKECKRMTEFLNACQQKGLTKSDIDKYYYL